MINKSWRTVLILGLVLAFIGLGRTGEAQQIPKNIPKKAPNPLLNHADLQVSWISAWPCACSVEAGAAGAIVLKGPIKVHVTNAGPKAADATVYLTCDDLNRSGSSMITKDVHLDVNQHVDLVFLENTSPTHMVLLRKSAGIESWIVMRTSGLTDPDNSNNKKRIDSCTQVVD